MDNKTAKIIEEIDNINVQLELTGRYDDLSDPFKHAKTGQLYLNLMEAQQELDELPHYMRTKCEYNINILKEERQHLWKLPQANTKQFQQDEERWYEKLLILDEPKEDKEAPPPAYTSVPNTSTTDLEAKIGQLDIRLTGITDIFTDQLGRMESQLLRLLKKFDSPLPNDNTNPDLKSATTMKPCLKTPSLALC